MKIMMPMKTRSRWERLRRKEEDGDAQAGEKEEKWFLRRRKKKRKKRKKKERWGRNKMNGLETYTCPKKGIKIMKLPIYPYVKI